MSFFIGSLCFVISGRISFNPLCWRLAVDIKRAAFFLTETACRCLDGGEAFFPAAGVEAADVTRHLDQLGSWQGFKIPDDGFQCAHDKVKITTGVDI